MTEAEKRRLQDAFRRLSASSGYISRQVFIKEVVGDALPGLLAEQIYSLCNGGLGNGSNGNGHNSVVGTFNQPVSKGLNFREVLAYLVLITRGTREEKIKCEFFFPLNMKKLKVLKIFATRSNLTNSQSIFHIGIQGCKKRMAPAIN